MRITFDAGKSAHNQITRGLPFERAADFDFANASMAEDTRQPYPEKRFVALGYLDERLHVLCFTPTADGIRIISFRRANAREVSRHEKSHTLDA